MKIAIAIGLVLASALIGLKFSRYYFDRVRAFSEMERLVRALAANFQFQRAPKEQVAQYEEFKLLPRELLFGEVERLTSLPFDEEERSRFSEFFSLLGRESAERELSRTRELLCYIEEKKAAVESAKAKGKLIPRLAAAVGALLALIVW